ncbi:hypothetical protein BEQ56_01535 [Anaerolineaceae bacterium oral taxon 439]|nr:hypothetical protein BEQ56_01535 [Anaerolineaceae bacterium oral taxon 439]
MTERKDQNVIHTEHLCKYYALGDVEVRALHDISIDINYGEFAAIMGPSGSGKSTLMNILGCLDRPTSGSYLLDGTEVSEISDNRLAEIRNRKIGFVFQSFNLLPRISALENVMLPLLYSKNKSRARDRALEALEQVGLAKRSKHKPKELSGGQQQRVAIARALVNDPEIIMADEPTGNLDSKSGKEIMQLLIRLNKENGKTVLMVTHDPKIGAVVPRVISVFDGMLGSQEEQEILQSWRQIDYSQATEEERAAVREMIAEKARAKAEFNTANGIAESEEDVHAGNASAAEAIAEAFGNGAAEKEAK